MTHQEILEKAIRKAIDGGWNGFDDYRVDDMHRIVVKVSGITMTLVYEQIIYTHPFAKALWGEQKAMQAFFGPNKRPGRKTILKDGWQYHLQQMVIADDPIAYLGDNI